MKSYLKVLFGVLIASFVQAQAPLVDASCCGPSNTSTPDSCTVFRYNVQNLVDLELKRVDGNDISRNLYSYTDQNEISAIQYQEFDGTDWQPKTLKNFAYDALGNRTIELDRLYENGDWVEVSQKLWTYSDTNNPNSPTIITNRTWDGAGWRAIDRNVFTYEDGLITSNRYDVFENGEWAFLRVEAYNFDANGNQTAYVLRNRVNGAWENDIQIITAYNDTANPNSPTIVLLNNWIDGAYVNISRELFTYSDNGGGETSITQINQVSNNGAWENVSLVATNFVDGNPTAEVLRDWVNGAWESTNQTLYTYNDNNTITTFRNWNGTAFVNISRDIVFFGDFGEITLDRHQEFVDNAWTTTIDCWSNFTVVIIDSDMDGFTSDEDCDDNNADVNPDAEEIAYNGLDDDCDPTTLDDDLDGDGFVLEDDCDDTDANINPDATEIPDNGIDEDCDGVDLMVSTNEIEFNRNYKVFPQPISTTLNIVSLSNSKFTYELRSINGSKILEGEESQIDVSDLNQGVYLLKVIETGSNKTYTKKLIKS